jgi:hypothetical protein
MFRRVVTSLDCVRFAVLQRLVSQNVNEVEHRVQHRQQGAVNGSRIGDGYLDLWVSLPNLPSIRGLGTGKRRGVDRIVTVTPASLFLRPAILSRRVARLATPAWRNGRR